MSTRSSAAGAEEQVEESSAHSIGCHRGQLCDSFGVTFLLRADTHFTLLACEVVSPSPPLCPARRTFGSCHLWPPLLGGGATPPRPPEDCQFRVPACIFTKIRAVGGAGGGATCATAQTGNITHYSTASGPDADTTPSSFGRSQDGVPGCHKSWGSTRPRLASRVVRKLMNSLQ